LDSDQHKLNQINQDCISIIDNEQTHYDQNESNINKNSLKTVTSLTTND